MIMTLVSKVSFFKKRSPHAKIFAKTEVGYNQKVKTDTNSNFSPTDACQICLFIQDFTSERGRFRCEGTILQSGPSL